MCIEMCLKIPSPTRGTHHFSSSRLKYHHSPCRHHASPPPGSVSLFLSLFFGFSFRPFGSSFLLTLYDPPFAPYPTYASLFSIFLLAPPRSRAHIRRKGLSIFGKPLQGSGQRFRETWQERWIKSRAVYSSPSLVAWNLQPIPALSGTILED